ncbi:Swarming motility protein SwrC [Kurthia sp. 3B1D]|uniref:Swarming motility protein SwrC n=1 Tax=Candidatus Kurthia intestinigallinarum TaxID=1562256 RepID=A0A433RTG4_9BACL|nr:efflux RND transporter permease subunit [Kurthia sp. 3B1D]RUS55457.1 Swarming motility protein SwrC [Kurthia sp. 3B1D]
MNGFVKFVLKNKLAVWLMTIILACAGVYSGLNMKSESIPDISVPIISVATVYPGATPEQVEEDISTPYEKAVANLEGVKTVQSTSYSNMSNIQVEFDYSTDMKEARQNIKEALEKVELPETAESPTIDRLSLNAFPVVALSVSSTDQDITELTKTAEDYLQPKMEQLDGVSSVSLSGQQVKKVELEFDDKKLAANGLTEDSVKQFIQAMDTTAPLGMFEFKDSEQSVVVDGKMTTLKKLKNLEIPVQQSAASTQASAAQAASQGQAQQAAGAEVQAAAAAAAQAEAAKPSTVKLKDIAKMELVGEVESVSRTNGKDAIAVQVVKAQDANTVDVVQEVKDAAKAFEKENPDVKIDVTLDQGDPIEKSVNTMLEKALFGALAAVVIIMLFLRNIRSTIISIISIPLSLLIAVIFLKELDITLNMMTLGAMTVAIGRVIDDSIVVVENIYRRLYSKDEKLSGRALIRSATLEMFRPILASTIVTVAVFLPIGLVGGMVGELFLPFALTMGFALFASLLVAITVVPVLAHSLFKKELYKEPAERAHKKEEHGKMARGYKRALKWILDHKWVTSIGAILLLVGSLFLAPLVGFSFLPDDEQKMAYVTYTPEPGQTRDQVIKDIDKAEKIIKDAPDVDTIQTSIGGSNPMMGGGGNGGLVYIIYDSDTENFADKKTALVKKIQAVDVPGEWKEQNFTGSSNSELSYSVHGNTIEDMRPVIKDMEAVMKKNNDLKDVKSSLSEEYDEKTLVVDQKRANELGLTTGQIAMAINPNVQATTLTTIKEDGKTIDVQLKTAATSPDTFEKVLAEKITTPTGEKVKLSEVVDVKKDKTQTEITRSGGKYYATVTATVTDKDISGVGSVVQKEIDKIDVPNGVTIDAGGVTEDIASTFSQLGLAIAAAIAIVYFVLVVTFGEGLAPFSILFSLPFTVIGALVALWIAGETISVSSLIGVLMLVGIVVTNAIVLVDRIIHMEHDGLSLREAILEAGATRLRPILMTAIATIAALVPLAIGGEGAGLISKGMGITVIGGLISSTVLTLIVVPLVYELLSKLLKKDRAHENKDI